MSFIAIGVHVVARSYSTFLDNAASTPSAKFSQDTEQQQQQSQLLQQMQIALHWGIYQYELSEGQDSIYTATATSQVQSD